MYRPPPPQMPRGPRPQMGMGGYPPGPPGMYPGGPPPPHGYNPQMHRMPLMGPPPLLIAPPQPPTAPKIAEPPAPVKPKVIDPEVMFTLYVGNIGDIENVVFEKVLKQCGNLGTWNRITGGDIKNKPLGFAVFEDAESAFRAFKVLNGFDLHEHKVVVRYDDDVKERMEKAITPEVLDSEMSLSQDDRARALVKEVLARAVELKAITEEARAILEPNVDNTNDMDMDVDEDDDVKAKDKANSNANAKEADGNKSPAPKDRERDRDRDRDRSRDRRSRDRDRDRDRDRSRRSRSPISRESRQKRKLDDDYKSERRRWENKERTIASKFHGETNRAKDRAADAAKFVERQSALDLAYDDTSEQGDATYFADRSTRRAHSYVKSKGTMQELQRTWDHEKKWMQRDRDEEQEAARKTEEAERPKTEGSETVVDVKPTIPVPEVAPPQQLQPPPSQPPSQPPAQPQPQPTVQQRETERQSHILNGAKDCINAARKLLQPPPVQPPPVQPPVQSPVQPSPVQPPVQQQPLQKQPSSIGFGLSLGGGGTSMKPKTKTAAKPSITNVFNPEEDDEDTTVKKRKLVKIAYTDQQLRAVGIDPEAERKKLVKEIISSIPTEKAELFSYTVHWDMADQDLVDTRIRPWVDRKITDFMGEPEADLVAFVCQQVKEQTKPSKILQELEPVLDDEAKLFVMKLWRLIIYETEFKRLDKAGQ